MRRKPRCAVSLELIKPVALALCMVSLCAVFHVAFLAPDLDLEQKCWQALVLLSISAGICLSSGMIFRPRQENSFSGCIRTLPMQIFFWTVGTMFVMFFAARYLETHCIFYKDIRRL
jgi:hypothetical protein